MPPVDENKKPYSLIVGMGATGLSIARHLHSRGEQFCVFDTRSECVNAEIFSELFPQAPLYFSVVEESLVKSAARICISPGVSQEETVIRLARQHGIPVIGDIGIFLEAVAGKSSDEKSARNKSIIGITGSNGKSTVTTLVGLALAKSGVSYAVGGNIGIPVLDLLESRETLSCDVYVLELSSFQLETLNSASLTVSCILNVSEDHMDRYPSLDEYTKAKQKIYESTKNAVFNVEDSRTFPAQGLTGKSLSFDSGHTGESTIESPYFYDVKSHSLMHETTQLLVKDAIKMKGKHNIANALAAFAILDCIGLQRKFLVEVLSEFSGLPHRTQWVAEVDGVTYINDSKATNVGAAEAAIVGLKDEFKGLLLIAGGDAKGADFSEFAQTIERHVRVVVLIGRDAHRLASKLGSQTEVFAATSMEEAVRKASQFARRGEAVLLSPACASLDMFDNYEHRGNVFSENVLKLNDLAARSEI